MRNRIGQAKFSVSVFALVLALEGPAGAMDTQSTNAQATQVLRDKIANLDRALFDAFNTCNVEKFNAFIAEDIEFYHDQHGLTVGRDTFVKSNKRRCEDLAQGFQRARRELVDGSLEVYPLNDYGAIEIGTHRFYVAERGRQEQLTSVAQFVHIWHNQNGNWRIARAFSYDHKDPARINEPLRSRELHDKIVSLDGAIGDAFNACNIDRIKTLVAADIEFFDGTEGLIASLESVATKIQKLCGDGKKSRRESVPRSLRVYPLNNFGAIGIGTHRFYQADKGTERPLVMSAKFVELWRNKDNEWKLLRALSFGINSEAQ
jgi:ketosteroid isomerase-like protein